jgi:uncharacterized protein
MFHPKWDSVRRSLIAAPVLATALLLSACGQSPQETKAVTLGTSSVGSTFYTLSVAMGDIISKNTDINASVVSVGGADATLRAIGDKKSELGMVHTWALYKAHAGEAPFDRKLNVRTLLTGQETGNCFIARADRGIKSPADLAGKTIVGERPALKSVDEYTHALLDLYGLKGKVKVISTAETREAMQAMQQGTVDAVVLPCGLRAPHIAELMESVASVTVDIPEDKMKELLAKTTPGATTGTNPPNTYKGQVNPYTIPVYQTVLVSSAELSEDAAYKVTKAIVEQQDALVAAHPTGRAWTLENTLRNTSFAVPFHAGAIKYFRERGVWQDAHEATQKRLLGD